MEEEFLALKEDFLELIQSINQLIYVIISFFITILPIIIIVIIVKKSKRKKYQEYQEYQEYPEYPEYQGHIQKNEGLEYIKKAYQQKWMFTLHEKNAYYRLNEIVKQENMILFAKVRLFDLVTPTKYHPKYKTNLYKIQAKHVDFVITKENLVAKYIIELDDSTHDTPKRRERDIFVDSVLQTCGYKVLHIREVEEERIRNFLRDK